MTPAADVTFRPSPGRTLGVEWELGLVDPTSLDLTSKAHELLAHIDAAGTEEVHARPTRTRSTVTKELLTNTVEIVTGICANAEQASTDLHDGLSRVRAAADDLGVDLTAGARTPSPGGRTSRSPTGSATRRSSTAPSGGVARW